MRGAWGSCAQFLCGPLLNTRKVAASWQWLLPPLDAPCFLAWGVGSGRREEKVGGLPCAEWAVGRVRPAVVRSDTVDGLASLVLFF